MATVSTRPELGRIEFTTMVAMIMASTALGIDLMLPAFGDIRSAFDLPADSTAVAGIVTAYFVGLAVAQLFYGPIADRFGRKTTLYAGYALYVVGAVGAALAPSLVALYLARFVWGVGAAGPRVVALSVIRDRFEGDRMARAMSFVMAIFIVVPVLAPALGAGILAVSSWRWVFASCALYAVAVALWARRLPETLKPEHRLELTMDRVLRAGRFVIGNRQTLGYTMAIAALFGAFSSYLASSELVIRDVFGRPELFPLIFGAIAAVIGATMLVNGTLVGRFGVRRLAHAALLAFVVMGAALTAFAVLSGGTPPLWPYLIGLAAMLGFYGLIFPNFNTIAMIPMGAVAGTAAAVIGTVSTAGGALLGALLDRRFDGTVTPLTVGFFILGSVCLGCVVWAERGRLFRPLEEPA